MSAPAAKTTAPLLAWSAVGLGSLALLLPLTAAWQGSANLGHGWLAPLLAAYLWWERWSERPALRPDAVPPRGVVALAAGVVLLGLALWPLRLLLTPYPLWPVALATYVGAIIGTAVGLAYWFAGRAGARWIGAPLALFLAALPLPTAVELNFILPLREAMASLAAEMANLLGRPAIASGTTIRLGSGWVGVDEACGGIRSLQGCVLLALFFGEWLRFTFLRRLLLVGAAVLAAVAGNFARVLFLAVRDSAEAIEQAHDLAGWLALALSVVATAWLALHWAGYRLPGVAVRRPAAPVPNANAGTRWRVALAFALALAAGELATRAWFATSPVDEWAETGWIARLPTGLQSFKPEPLTESAREMLSPDFFAAGNWRSHRDEPVAAFYIEWRRGQAARFVPFMHNPTICLPVSGCELQEELPGIELERAGERIPFRLLRFRRAGQELLVAFTVWDPLTQAPLQPASSRKTFSAWVRSAWDDVLLRREHQPAQMFTLALQWDAQAPAQLEQWLDRLVLSRAQPAPAVQ